MSSTIVNPAMQEWLSQIRDITELRDSAGNLLGVFTPKHIAEESLLYDKVKDLFDPAETERILREEKGQGIPLAEFWKQLEAKQQS